MTTFTITTAQNWDELTPKAGGDTYNVNGGTLTIDQDTRYGLNTTTTTGSATAITLHRYFPNSNLEVDARYVRLIPYDNGTGNVPTGGTTISQGSASGKLICVMSALTAAPTAAGAAMPASGFIKIKQWNSIAFAAGALSGIGANATGADVVGWISLCNDESGTITGSAFGTLRFRGANFAVGTTDGNRATTYQLPTQGEAIYLPGVQVETAVGSGIYEWYPNAGSQTALLANIGTESARGKVCWIDSTGILRFGNDGTNSTGGYCPVSGLKIRIPNIYMHSCTTGARGTNAVPNAASLATRFEFAGVFSIVEMDTVFSSWYLNFSDYKTVTINNCGLNDQLYLSEIRESATITDTLVCFTQAQTSYALYLQLCWLGFTGTFTNCMFVRYSLASSSQYCAYVSRNTNFTFTGCTFRPMVNRSAVNCGAVTIEYCSNFAMRNCTFMGARPSIAYCHHVTIENSTYIDVIAGTTVSTNPLYGIELGNYCRNIIVDGVNFGGLRMVQPWQPLVYIANWSKKIIVRNIGTIENPLELGDTQQGDVAWTRVTTTATVTKTAHGLKANDNVYVIISSDTGAISIAIKTVVATPTADTFTFACTNAGATSGTLSYYPSVCQQVVAIGQVCEDIYCENLYCQHARSNPYSSDNSCRRIHFKNVWSDIVNGPVVQANDSKHLGIGSPGALVVQGGTEGSHWFHWYQGVDPPNKSGVAWTRVTTTATITSNNHGIRTGDRISVTVSSDTSTITLGTKPVTVLDSNRFTISCVNGGSASGTLTFIPENVRITLIANNPSTRSLPFVVTDVGNPVFTHRGEVYFPLTGDQITWEMEDYILGFSSFSIDEPVMGVGNILQFHTTYSIDTGSGFGAFKNLMLGVSGSGSGGSTNITMPDTSNVGVGDYVFGAGVSPLAKVESITNETTVVVSAPHTGVLSGTIRFNHLPNEVVDPQVGCKLKIRVRAVVDAGTYWTYMVLFAFSSTSDRAAQYPSSFITDDYLLPSFHLTGGMQRG